MAARIPLALTCDQTQVDQVRPLLESRRCVVVGSAPLPTKTAVIEPGEFVVCVNGAISSLATPPDLWLLNSKPHRMALHVTMLNQARKRQAQHVVFLRGNIRPTEQESLAFLAQIGCRISSWSVLDKPTKRWLEETICDRQQGQKSACSSGLFAAALALWCGAERVRLTGFSWKNGYQYLRGTLPPRGHLEPDRRALQALTARYPSQLVGALVPVAVAS